MWYLFSRIIDIFEGNYIIRIKGSDTRYLENNNVIKTSKLIKFSHLERYKIKNVGWLPNPNVGAIYV